MPVTTKKKTKTSVDSSSSDISNLPLVPLSPIAQSYILCSNALKVATDKLTEAKKRTHHSDALPPIPVSVLRGLLETTKVESHRLKSLTRKMQSVEAATALYWNPDELAKQIAIVDSQLFNEVNLDKRSLLSAATMTTASSSSLDATKLKHLMDFHHYLSHSFAHQVIYWVHLLNTYNPSTTSSTTAAAVIPPVVNPQHLNKENLLTHLIRVAYLLLHAYFDFSGFAAIMKALTFPEVRRLFHNTTGGSGQKKLSIWEHTNSKTKDMFRDLVRMISSESNYQAYHQAFRAKLLEQQLKQQTSQSQQFHQQQHSHDATSTTMLTIPWIDPHLSKIKSIVDSYKAGDHVHSEDRFLSSFLGVGHHSASHSSSSNNAVVLSAPGAHKLEMEVSLLELSQRNACTSEHSLEDILKTEVGIDASTEELLAMLGRNKKSNSKRNSLSAATAAVIAKTIHIDGLRTAILPAANLNSLVPGKQLIHHWVVSRVYLTKEQLISESMEVEPLRSGEQQLALEPATTQVYNGDAAASVSQRNSMIVPTATVSTSHTSSQEETESNVESDSALSQVGREDPPQEQELHEIKRKPNTAEGGHQYDEYDGQELQTIRETNLTDGIDEENSSDENNDNDGENLVGNNKAEVDTLELSRPTRTTPKEIATAEEVAVKSIGNEQQTELEAVQSTIENIKTNDEENEEEGRERDSNPASIDNVINNADDAKEMELKEMKPEDDIQKERDAQGHQQQIEQQQLTSGSVLSHPSTATSKPKSSLSPTAPEFVPKQYKSTTTIATISSKSSEEVWRGYPVGEEGEAGATYARDNSTMGAMEAGCETESEQWAGYPVPSNDDAVVEESAAVIVDNDKNDRVGNNLAEEDEDEVWKGYPGPNSSTDSPRRASSQSETSEEWKGYHATKMEADWQRESALKVQEHEWQGYTLETLDEDELDSSTMMNGEFEKSRQARHENHNMYQPQQRGRRHI